MACISLFLGFETCFENEREMELHTVNFDVLLNFIRGYPNRYFCETTPSVRSSGLYRFEFLWVVYITQVISIQRLFLTIAGH
jgi:hypothetical protein